MFREIHKIRKGCGGMVPKVLLHEMIFQRYTGSFCNPPFLQCIGFSFYLTNNFSHCASGDNPTDTTQSIISNKDFFFLRTSPFHGLLEDKRIFGLRNSSAFLSSLGEIDRPPLNAISLFTADKYDVKKRKISWEQYSKGRKGILSIKNLVFLFLTL